MRPPFYIRQLKQDLEVWISKGLVPEESREAILASIGAGSAARRLDVILAIFGVILIGAGAMSFVAANWATMEKFTRLVVLFGSMWAAYAIAIWFVTNGRGAIGQAFVLLGVILFGVNIWFVAQTYNISAHYPDGTLLWGLGAMAAAALVPSRAALAFAIVLGGVWTWQETQYFNDLLHAPYFLYWALGATMAWYVNWRPGIHLSALALIFWLVINFESLSRLLGWGDSEILTIYIFVPLAIWSASQLFERDANAIALTVGHYAFFFFLVAYGILHHTDMGDHMPAGTWVGFAAIMSAASVGAVLYGTTRGVFSVVDALATLFVCLTTIAYVFAVGKDGDQLDVPYLVCTLLIIIWSVGRGARFDDRFVINLSTVAFGVWFLYVYFELFAGLMDQAVFFTVGGILLVALSLGLEGIRRRLIAGTKAAPTQGAAQ
jgi:uncharacterized membrane protein